MKRRMLTIIALLLLVTGIELVCSKASAQRNATATGSSGEIATRSNYTLSGPYSHKNLTVFLIHGQNQMSGKAPLTLQEALKQKKVIVRETGDVNELTIQNKSSEAVFVQAGDIVKGGQQDRVLALDMIVPPKSRRVKIDAFCVEQSRWEQRGTEAVTAFSSSQNMIASRELKVAAKASASQDEVWRNVSVAQEKLAKNYAAAKGIPPVAADSRSVPVSAGVLATPAPAPNEIQNNVTVTRRAIQQLPGQNLQGRAVLSLVASDASPSSLQLTLEHKNVKETTQEYIKQLSAIIAGKNDVIGYVFAINGQINSADVYSSSALFKKLWPKLLEASAVEAFAELQPEARSGEVTADAARTFLKDSEAGAAETKRLPSRTTVVKRESDKNLFFETRDRARNDAWVHRNYLTK